MTINLNQLIHVKLDIDEMNYTSWVYFFMHLCRGNGLLEHILGKDEATTSDNPPPDAEWVKIDTIILSWIFVTLSSTLQARLVGESSNDERSMGPSCLDLQ